MTEAASLSIGAKIKLIGFAIWLSNGSGADPEAVAQLSKRLSSDDPGLSTENYNKLVEAVNRDPGAAIAAAKQAIRQDPKIINRVNEDPSQILVLMGADNIPAPSSPPQSSANGQPVRRASAMHGSIAVSARLADIPPVAASQPVAAGSALNQPLSNGLVAAGSAVDSGNETELDERIALVEQIAEQGFQIRENPNVKKIMQMGHDDPEIGQFIENITDINMNEDPAKYLDRLKNMSLEDLRKQKAMLDNAENLQSMTGWFANSPQWLAHGLAAIGNSISEKVDLSSLLSGNFGGLGSNLSGILDGLANGIFQLIGEALKSFSGSGSDFGLGTLLSANNSGGQQTANLAAVSEEITGNASPPVESYDENGAPQGTAALAPAPVAGGPTAARPATA